MTSTATDKPAFSLNVTDQQGAKVFHLHGRLMDQQQADHLMQVLDTHLKSNEGVNVVLDMGELVYMNSTGLNIMISVFTRTRNAGGQVVLAAISHGVRQLFVVTKLDTVFPILDTVELALAKLRA
ncbi:MAG: STAS domain-containing protein [Flavobacteriales bacterium]|nr:STAS domain-containing protein [Flavobacteriales bacterium]MBP9079708.1 STAS domain-containing protein [Flavobacteriales bacterium]